MAPSRLAPQDMPLAEGMVLQGIGWKLLARRFGLRENPARRILEEIRRRLGVSPDMRLANKQVQASLDTQISLAYEEAIRKVSKLAQSRDRVITWRAPNPKGLTAIAFMADWHLGCIGTDYGQLDRDIDTVLNTPGMYAVLPGDLIDNHIRHLAAVIAQDMTPNRQWEWLGRVFDRLGPKLIAVIGGNHEAWTLAVSGFDPLKALADKLTTPYDSDEALLYLDCGKSQYLSCVRHKYRFNSAFNPSHSVKRLWEFGPADWDIGVVCHKHQAVVEPFYRHGRQRWVLRPGSYQVASGYSRREGFPDGVPVSPAIVLDGKRRAMHGFIELDWAAKLLNSQ